MKLNKNFRQIFAVIVFVATAASAQAANQVVQPGDEFAGRSYNQLVSEWTSWLTAEPIATNPAFDADGSFCDRNQQGPVWFLASTFGGVADRTCEIPEGKAIFLSLGGAFVSFAPEFPAANDPCSQMATDVERVRCDVNNDVPVAPAVSFAVTLDGQPIGDLLSFRAQSQPGGFTLKVPNPSFLTDLGLPAGDRFPTVGDGYFLFLKPLEPGVHTLTLRMNNPDQTVTGVNYTLIIQ
jgi:hypothetical protein